MIEAPYLGPEGGRPGRPTQAVGHTCSGHSGIVKILYYIIRSDMCTASATNSKLLYITQSPNPPNTVLHRSHDEIVKLNNREQTEQSLPGADLGFQVRGAHLKIAPSGGRRNFFVCISCGKSRFYAKKSYFFQF
jgi:hypothetical protein